jgi:hypothetical protein
MANDLADDAMTSSTPLSDAACIISVVISLRRGQIDRERGNPQRQIRNLRRSGAETFSSEGHQDRLS